MALAPTAAGDTALAILTYQIFQTGVTSLVDALPVGFSLSPEAIAPRTPSGALDGNERRPLTA
jgi:hypothetical protein